jgi:crotonobetainyl-CoA:carnitine CoA-transferase CaiB-like acyl-CoA transferase
MSDYRFAAPCQPDPGDEHDHLAGLLPAGMLPPARRARPPGDDPAACAVLAWARSGLMHLTGQACGPPLSPRAPVMARAAVIAAAITELTGRQGDPVRLGLDHVLAFRASQTGWARRGTVSLNGTCRILRAADGWVAVNLARPDDLRSVPAVLGRNLPESGATVWEELQAEAAARPAAGLAAAAQAVGIPAAALRARALRPAPALPPAEFPAPVTATRLGPAGTAPRLVLDLSAMWAGPLCASILGRAGWRVLKVEDVHRPDGARSGPPAFYADLHAGSRTVILDFGSAQGRAELSRLAGQAGVVVESSRPRALRRLGLVAEDWLGASPGRVWVSVTGYGRRDPQQRVAFGDDAAVGGGLVAWAADGTPVFCGDAIADPLSGLHAAMSVLAANAAGGGWLVDVAMAGVCADLARPSATPAWPHVISPGRARGADRGAEVGATDRAEGAAMAGGEARAGGDARAAGAGWQVRHGEVTEPVRSW